MPLRPVIHPVSVILDSNVFRQTLFGGSHILSALATLARQGKATLFLPSLVNEEVLSNLGNWIDAEIPLKLDKETLKAAKKADLDTALLKESIATKSRIHTAHVTQINERYAEWKKHSDCQVIEITLDDSKAVWKNYFLGGPPFDRPKNKEHLPDAHIYQCVRSVAEMHSPCVFISADRKLRQHIANIPEVRVFANTQDFLAAHDHDKGQHYSRQHSLPDDKSLEAAFTNGLIGCYIQRDELDWIVKSITVTCFQKRRESVVVLDANIQLIGIVSRLKIELIHSTKGKSSYHILRRLASAEIEGTMAFNEASSVIELDDYSLLDFSWMASEIVEELPRDPDVGMEPLYKQRCETALRRLESGIIFVTGGNSAERCKMAETLCQIRCAILDNNPYAVRFIPVNEPDQRIHDFPYPKGKLITFVRERHVDILLVDADKLSWEQLFQVLAERRYALMIAVTTKARGADAVAREVAKVSIGVDPIHYLKAVVDQTKRKKGMTYFNFQNGSSWGDGTFYESIRRAESLKNIG